MKKTKNSKTRVLSINTDYKKYKPAPSAHFTPVSADTRDNINWQAKLYKDINNNFYNTASFSTSGPAIVTTAPKKKYILAGIAAARKVRTFRPLATPSASKYVMVAGIPHIMRNGTLVRMVPAASSKKWDIIEYPVAKRKNSKNSKNKKKK